MMQTIRKWAVEVTFADRAFVFWVHDNFLANVLRTVAGLDFSANGLEQPSSIRVSEAVIANAAVGVFTGVRARTDDAVGQRSE
jgi:hypothetical protein